MQRQDAKSLALFRAIEAKISESDDPRIYLRRAREWAAHFSAERPEDIWLAEWVARLDAALISEESLGNLYTLMLSGDQHAIEMRASSPFPGVLTQKERTAALRAFETEWAA